MENEKYNSEHESSADVLRTDAESVDTKNSDIIKRMTKQVDELSDTSSVDELDTDDEKKINAVDDDDDDDDEVDDDDDEVDDDDDDDVDDEVVVDGDDGSVIEPEKNETKKSKKTQKQKPQESEQEYEDDDDDESDDEDCLKKLDEDMRQNIIAKWHPDMIQHNDEEIETLCKIVRDADGNIIDPLHKTLPFITKYEKARILGERAKQINSGAKPFIKVEKHIIDGYLIAMREFEEKKIPFIIRRPLPSGASEYWKLADLQFC